jgi:predicted nuclease of predicted toxin-antitoxin system
MADEEVIKVAKDEDRIIITLDRDFGQLAQRYTPPGVVILRLKNHSSENRIRILRLLLERRADRLKKRLTIVSETAIRMRSLD